MPGAEGEPTPSNANSLIPRKNAVRESRSTAMAGCCLRTPYGSGTVMPSRSICSRACSPRSQLSATRTSIRKWCDSKSKSSRTFRTHLRVGARKWVGILNFCIGIFRFYGLQLEKFPQVQLFGFGQGQWTPCVWQRSVLFDRLKNDVAPPGPGVWNRDGADTLLVSTRIQIDVEIADVWAGRLPRLADCPRELARGGSESASR